MSTIKANRWAWIVAGLAMLTGLVISWGIAVPILTSMAGIPADMSLAKFATGLWSSQVRFIGAGVIGVGAIWTLATLFMPMARGVKASFAALTKAGAARAGRAPRTERDLSAGWISVVTLALVVVLVVTFQVFLSGAPLSAGAIWKLVAYAMLFAFVFGFLVAAACGYMAGLVGSSTSPISGVGIVAIVLVSLLMLTLGGELLGAENGVQMAIALSIFSTSAVVAVASISNDNLQDLKTGWLVGATPWRQQVALLIGCVAGAAVISPVLELLYNAYGFADSMPREGMDPAQALSAPQATLMLAIARGIFTHQLNWTMIVIGMLVGLGLILVDQVLKRTCRVARMPVLAVGIGIYLPPTVAAPIVAGAVLAWLLERALRRRAAAAGQPYEQFADAANRRGVLIASGLIVGESLVGVLMAAGAGRLADRGLGERTTAAGLALLCLSWAPIALLEHSLWLLALGVLVLDVALQALHVTNQAMIFGISAQAHSRLVGGYMMFYAAGSGLGSIASTAVYAQAGWPGVCALGAAISLAALAFWWFTRGVGGEARTACANGA